MDEQTVSPVTAQPQPDEHTKKPYTPPQVVVHGTVAELTQAKGGTSPEAETASFLLTIN